jgi:carboxypeptidase Q
MPMRFSITLLFAIFLSNLQAQPETVDYQTISKIKDEGFNRSQVMETLFNVAEVCGPRLSGSAGLKKAEEWTRQRLESWGLQNAVIESWGGFGRGWEIRKAYVAMTAPYYQQLIAVPKAWTPGTNGPVSAPAVLVRIDSEADFEKYKGQLAGKIAVIASGAAIRPGLKPEFRRHTEEDLKDLYMDRHVHDDDDGEGGGGRTPAELAQLRLQRQLRQKMNAFLLEQAPAAVLSGRGGTMGTLNTSNGASYKTWSAPALPEMEMSTEHLLRLVRLLEAKKEVALELDIQTAFSDQDTVQYNVIAEIPGTDKNLKAELVMLGAHLDSWHAATGATDNAAGVAVMMEAVRILQAIEAKPRRTIRLALWSGEEQGLLGSRGYVKNHFADPETMELKPEHARLSAYYNLDNGHGRVRGIYLQGNDALRPVFEAWLEPFRDLGAATVTARNTGSTDHVAFDRVGLPGFQFIQDPLDYFSKTHHTNMDTYDRIQENDLMQAAVVIAAVVWQTAQREEKLPRKALPKVRPKT